MKPTEKKFVYDLISLVANAVATDTISEAEDYLVDHYQGEDVQDDDDFVVEIDIIIEFCIIPELQEMLYELQSNIKL